MYFYRMFIFQVRGIWKTLFSTDYFFLNLNLISRYKQNGYKSNTNNNNLNKKDNFFR